MAGSGGSFGVRLLPPLSFFRGFAKNKERKKAAVSAALQSAGSIFIESQKAGLKAMKFPPVKKIRDLSDATHAATTLLEP
jgi:hypothetical protein